MGFSALFLLYDDVAQISKEFMYISFSYVNRLCNSVAHHLAKWGSNLVEETVLLEDAPLVVSPYLSADLAGVV